MILQLILYTLMIFISFYIFGVLEYYFKMKRDVEIIKLKNKLEQREEYYTNKLVMGMDLRNYKEKYYESMREIDQLEERISQLNRGVDYYIDENQLLLRQLESLHKERDELTRITK